MFRRLNNPAGGLKNADGSVPWTQNLCSAQGIKSMAPLASFDDFQQYGSAIYTDNLAIWHDPIGITVWAGPWFFFLMDYDFAREDWQDYASASYNSGDLSGGLGFSGAWTFGDPLDYDISREDFQDYASNTYNSGDLNGGSSWTGAWTIYDPP